MRAIDLDTEVSCPVCTNAKKGIIESWGDDCPRCGGDGVINRFRQRTEDDEIVIYEEMKASGDLLVFIQNSLSEEEFDIRYGPKTPNTKPDAVVEVPLEDGSTQTRDRTGEVERLMDPNNPSVDELIEWADEHAGRNEARGLRRIKREFGL